MRLQFKNIYFFPNCADLWTTETTSGNLLQPRMTSNRYLRYLPALVQRIGTTPWAYCVRSPWQTTAARLVVPPLRYHWAPNTAHKTTSSIATSTPSNRRRRQGFSSCDITYRPPVITSTTVATTIFHRCFSILSIRLCNLTVQSHPATCAIRSLPAPPHRKYYQRPRRHFRSMKLCGDIARGLLGMSVLQGGSSTSCRRRCQATSGSVRCCLLCTFIVIRSYRPVHIITLQCRMPLRRRCTTQPLFSSRTSSTVRSSLFCGSFRSCVKILDHSPWSQSYTPFTRGSIHEA